MNTWHKMIPLWQLKTVFLMAILLCLGLLVAIIPIDTQAQGPALPTPTNVGAGGGGSGSGGSGSGKDGGGRLILQGASVSGFVYNYSTGGYEGGATVIITGDGWQTETVSDSNGFYRIGNLGAGRGTVNLRLPPGTQPVVFDWPVWTYEGADLKANLGYFWGDQPPMPVLLSANLEANVLTVQVENFTSETSTGAVIEVETPGQIRLSPAVETKQGKVAMEYDPHQLRLSLADLSPDAKTVVNVFLSDQSAQTDTDPPLIRVILTYDQQHTPQIITFGSNSLGPIQSPNASNASVVAAATRRPSTAAQSAGLVESGLMAAESGQAAQATPAPQSTAIPQPDASSSAGSVQSAPAAEATTPPETVEPALISPLPDTGGASTSRPDVTAKLALSVITVLGLAVTGWWSFKAKSGTVS